MQTSISVGEFAGSTRPLRVAMVVPPYFTVPPAAYGGVESVVADLVDQLVERGHHVTLVGAGTHGTRAQRFLRTLAEPQSEHVAEVAPEATHAARAARLLAHEEVDLVHDHTLAGLLTAPQRRVPTVATVHGPSRDLSDYYRAVAGDVHLVALSEAQRRAAPDLRWVATVPNGIDVASFPFRRDKEDFVLFLGRYHPQKAPHLAIDAARRAGRRIVLAGKCTEQVECQYFETEIRPRLGPGVTVLGVADAAGKRDLLSRASCLVFPIQWEEPFGLVMAEAMACGTPVVATSRGAVPEVVVHGRTGIVVAPDDDLARAIRATSSLDPGDCRRHAAEHFTTALMATRYEQVYQRVLGARPDRAMATPPQRLGGRRRARRPGSGQGVRIVPSTPHPSA